MINLVGSYKEFFLIKTVKILFTHILEIRYKKIALFLYQPTININLEETDFKSCMNVWYPIQDKSLRKIVDAPWFIDNSDLPRYLYSRFVETFLGTVNRIFFVSDHERGGIITRALGRMTA